MEGSGRLELGRQSFDAGVWNDAYDHLTAADQATPLEPQDLERVATAASLAGHEAESGDAWSRAHQEWLRRGEPGRAVRCAFWLGFGLVLRGEAARGGGWLARAGHLVEEHRLDTVEPGYLLVPEGLMAIDSGEVGVALAHFDRVKDFARRPTDRHRGPGGNGWNRGGTMSTTDHDLTLDQHRARLLAGLPVTERRVDAAGIPTIVLDGGEGPPVVLLHGPGESAVNWRWTIPDLVTTHRVVAPDLPAHGSSGTGDQRLDVDRAMTWLDALIDRMCDEPPTLVGHVLGGAIAARFASRHPSRVRRLVLVDSLGLGRFRPSLRFALGFLGFQARPHERSYERFMGQCTYDLDELRRDLGDDWTSFVAYNLGMARSDAASEAGRLFRKAGVPRIPDSELARIEAPTWLIWGRQDRALRLRIAERASARNGWPLQVIDRAADDPARDQPEEFLAALRKALKEPVGPD